MSHELYINKQDNGTDVLFIKSFFFFFSTWTNCGDIQARKLVLSNCKNIHHFEWCNDNVFPWPFPSLVVITKSFHDIKSTGSAFTTHGWRKLPPSSPNTNKRTFKGMFAHSFVIVVVAFECNLIKQIEVHLKFYDQQVFSGCLHDQHFLSCVLLVCWNNSWIFIYSFSQLWLFGLDDAPWWMHGYSDNSKTSHRICKSISVENFFISLTLMIYYWLTFLSFFYSNCN